MAEENTVDKDVEYDDDGNPIVEDEDKNVDEGGEGDPDKKDTDTDTDEDTEEDKKDEEDKFDDDAEPVIPTRKSNLQFIISRKNKQIEDLKKGNQDKGEGDNDEWVDNDNDLTPESKKAVEDTVSEMMKPITEKMISDASEKELETLFKEHPESKGYEKHIRAYMSHESYREASPLVIFHHLAFDKALAIGAKRAKMADGEADATKGGGRDNKPKNAKSSTGLPTPEEIENMTEEEFAELEDKARQGEFVNNQ